MPNLNEAFPSNWLKINKNVKHGDIITFVDEGKVVANGVDEKGQPRYTLNITVEVERTKEQKQFSVNATNRKATQAIYGTDTTDWIGKSMSVVMVRNNNPKTGSRVEAIELVAPNNTPEMQASQ